MSIPCVQSSDVLNISGFGQILPWLLERKGTPLWYLLAYAEHSSFVGAEPTELLSLVHPRQPSCGNEREWSSLGGQLGLSYAALCAWKDTKPELLAFVLNCSAGEHQSCQCTPAPQEDAPAPLASAQGSTCFPQTHLHDINSSENCTCTYPLLGGEGFPAELWSRTGYRCHLSLVEALPGSFCPAVEEGVWDACSPVSLVALTEGAQPCMAEPEPLQHP